MGDKRSFKKGKTFEEIYGVARAKEIKQKSSISHKGYKPPREQIEKQMKTTRERKAKGLIHPGSHGVKHTKEWREAHRTKMIGRIHTWGDKISKAKKGKSWEEMYGKETAERMRQTWRERNLGKTLSAEVKQKISSANQGIPNKYKGKTYDEIFGTEQAEEIRGRLSEAQSLENNAAWLGGISYEPYTPDFNTRFKVMVRARDNHCCVICNKHEEDLNRALAIHHVDYDKKNSFPQNCVSLCLSCHMKTNLNRNQWKVFFQSLLAERYNYEYTLDQRIILDFIEGKQ